MPKTHITAKEVPLNNNCPECYNKGLVLTFRQQIIETRFYKSITSKIALDLVCKVCQTTIYPVQWTDDIERVVTYQKKAFTPARPSSYLKKTSRIIIIVIAIVILTLAALALYLK